jgi:hypothetical protein
MAESEEQKLRGKLIYCDNFDRNFIDESNWIANYLPHWTTPELAIPHHHFEDGHLVLRLDADQSPWCPDHDGGVKCSSIQTGHFSGPLGAVNGQLRFNKNLRVVTELPSSQLYVPKHGYFEVRAKAKIASNNMVAFWMMGFEELPDDSGEITVMEIFGRNCTASTTTFGYGIKQAADPRLQTEYHEDVLPFDVADWHVYGAEWNATGVTHFLDGEPLRHIKMAPQYPLQLMLGIYELPNDPQPIEKQTATFTIDYVKGYAPA